MDKQKNYKKYLLIKACFGTEPYVNSRLEMDIKDVIEYTLIPSEEINEYDVVKILHQSDDKEELNDLLEQYREQESFFGY